MSLPEKEHYPTDYELGQDNLEIYGLDVHNPVFFISAGLIIIFVIVTIMFPEQANDMLGAVKTWCVIFWLPFC